MMPSVPLGPQKYFRQSTNTVIKTNTITHFYLLQRLLFCVGLMTNRISYIFFLHLQRRKTIELFPPIFEYYFLFARTELLASNKTLAIFDSSFFLEACHLAEIFIFLLPNPMQTLTFFWSEPLPVTFATSQMHRDAHRTGIFFPVPYFSPTALLLAGKIKTFFTLPSAPRTDNLL